ncbi:MAG TPA: thiamine pyrophosphate-binding protein, partial [Kofleriaceae bacterium]|nr:thiamine pyrophosphate-binding protein [Kofleriaceae bacterium]
MAAPQRVLVVDDNELYLRALQRQCRDEHAFTLTVVNNANDALAMIASSKPDLVIMDMFMPSLDGVEACRQLKANPKTSEVPVIVATVDMSEELAAVCAAAGAGAVSKPFCLKDLVPPTQTRVAADAPAVMTQTTETTRGADLLVGMLADAGVDVVFGLPGGAISPVHDAMLGASMRLITTRHEAGAMFAAAGYAQSSGKLGVVAVTSGPGALNALTGLASAWCDSLP